MFAVVANNGKFYNGRAGSLWLGDKAEAFTYSKEGAERKATQFNQATCLHGLTFKVEEM